MAADQVTSAESTISMPFAALSTRRMQPAYSPEWPMAWVHSLVPSSDEGRSLVVSGSDLRSRGLMRETPLLVVLDEPSASLDAPTEAALFRRYREAAQRLGKANGTITILVSHRFSTVHVADQIVVLEGGSVEELGTHKDLLELGGFTRSSSNFKHAAIARARSPDWSVSANATLPDQ